MKNRVTVLGITGMLGYMVYDMLRSDPSLNVKGTTRQFLNAADVFLDENTSSNIDTIVENSDYIINCIGVIKPKVKNREPETVLVNSYFPWFMSNRCINKSRFINITTDCVFSGKSGKYDEIHEHDCLDFYGKSKSMGEPNNCMNIRTSIIGEEKYHTDSLIEWCKSQKGNKVNGYINHFWNGITTKEYAKIISKIIYNDLYKDGVFHVFSNDISKCDMLKKISNKFHLELDVKEHTPDESVDRTLRTIHRLNSELEISSFDDMLSEL